MSQQYIDENNQLIDLDNFGYLTKKPINPILGTIVREKLSTGDLYYIFSDKGWLPWYADMMSQNNIYGLIRYLAEWINDEHLDAQYTVAETLKEENILMYELYKIATGITI